MLTLLHGHINEETAYTIEDYPYGRQLRCKRKVWIETATKGKGKGQQRFAAMTNNPKITSAEVWNKPHYGNYFDMCVLYRDESNGHIEYACISSNVADESIIKFAADWLDQMNEEELKRFQTIVYMSIRYNPNSWGEWRQKHIETFKKFGLPVEGPLPIAGWMKVIMYTVYLEKALQLPKTIVIPEKETLNEQDLQWMRGLIDESRAVTSVNPGSPD